MSKFGSKTNNNCLLARNGFRPYERCDYCDLKTSDCMGMQYNLFVLIISILLILFLFLDDIIWIRINIAAVITVIVIMGYRVMVNTDELARASAENDQLNKKLSLKDHYQQEEIARQTKELVDLATHDKLTGLSNRYEFEKRLEKALENAKAKNKSHVLCYMDLDQFKVVNDTSGHVAGDALLRQISTLLSEELRGADLLARLGGDEFGIIFYNCELDDAKMRATELLEIIRSFRFVWEDKMFTIGASLGMVRISPTCDNLNNLMISADAACYTAKENGRNRIHAFEQLDVELAKHRNDVEWLEEIRLALDENRFLLYGQPIVALQKEGEKVHHFELLIRMQSRDGKIIEPMAFIPPAERYNAIKIIDSWVVQAALNLQRELLDQGYRAKMGINLSGQSLGDEALINQINDLFIETEVPHDLISFEVTETAAISNLGNALRFIKEFRSLGCTFALDDFGAGLSSFAYLKNIPVDYLKIDGQFVKDMDKNVVHAQMVQAIGDIAKVMGIETICEYVERREVAEMLKPMGIDYAQGHLYCVASDIKECIKNSNAGRYK